MHVSELIKISRPKFWLYVFGMLVIGWIVGFAESGSGLFEIRDLVLSRYQDPFVLGFTLIAGLYFLLPANLLIYGVNDISDHETDALNEKKGDFEMKVEKAQFKILWKWILGINIPFWLALIRLNMKGGFFSSTGLAIGLGGFVFFSLFYSLEPIRAKSKPFIDGIFNILYGFSALFGRVIAGESMGDVQFYVIIAAVLFFMARHAFSAVPDIEPDKQARLVTTAVLLGEKTTLWYCLILRFVAFALLYGYLGLRILPGILVFCGFCVLALIGDTMQVYKYIPWTIPLIGTLYFWVVLLG